MKYIAVTLWQFIYGEVNLIFLNLRFRLIRIYMMTRLFYLFVLLVVFSSCDKDDNEKNALGEPFKMDIELSSELRNQITEIVPIAFLKDGSRWVIGESNKTQNGFELYLQNPLNSTFLYPLKEYTDFMHGEINNDVMCYGSVSLYAYNENELIGTLKRFYFYNDLKNRNEVFYDLRLMYVTSDAIVNGDCIIDGAPFKSYDVDLKQGWNLYTCIQTISYTLEGVHKNTSSEYVSEISNDLDWQF